jgi:ornithine carbamoyltransferase
MEHFISLKDFSSARIRKLIKLSIDIKAHPFKYKSVLKDRSIGLLFQKPSLRTKTSFYIGALQLGGSPIYYAPEEVKLGKRENVADVSRSLSKYLDAIILRTFSHNTIREFAKFSSIPVINGLSDLCHPSQVLADILTICELKGDIKKIKLSYIGDGNNVCHSLIYAFSILGGNLCIATPKGYSPDREVLKEAKKYALLSGAKITFTNSPKDILKGSDVIYTDVWTSMGKEKERDMRKKHFQDFQINDKILKLANKDCIVMHCLPAHRGEEITDSVLDSKKSVVFLQAENRLYTAKAILVYLLSVR